jgi:hypothetical protein
VKHKIVVSTAPNDAIVAVCVDCKESIFNEDSATGSLNRINAAAKRHKKAKKVIGVGGTVVETPEGISVTGRFLSEKITQDIVAGLRQGLATSEYDFSNFDPNHNASAFAFPRYEPPTKTN